MDSDKVYSDDFKDGAIMKNGQMWKLVLKLDNTCLPQMIEIYLPYWPMVSLRWLSIQFTQIYFILVI